MSQRAIDSELVKVTCEFGKRDHRNRIYLNMKELDGLLAHLDARKRHLIRARQKGGIVVVEEDGYLITTYARGRENKSRRRGK